jgi:hypothetical protein
MNRTEAPDSSSPSTKRIASSRSNRVKPEKIRKTGTSIPAKVTKGQQ